MKKLTSGLTPILLFMIACQSPKTQTAPPNGLVKIRYSSEAELEQLRQNGAEIVVKQPDYAVIRTSGMASAESVRGERIEESDLVQRLVHIALSDSGDVQKIVDTGVDLWEVRGDTVIAQAFDLYIEKLRADGFSVRVVAENARKREGGRR